MFRFFRKSLDSRFNHQIFKKPRFQTLEILCLEGRVTPSTFFVTNTNDSGEGSLRQAIVDANLLEGPDTIQFDAGLTQSASATLSLTSTGDTTAGASAFGIYSDITIQGPTGSKGITLNNNSSFGERRLFYVDQTGSLTLHSLTLSGGKAQGGDGGSVAGGAAGLGGAIFNQGNLTISNSTLTENQAVGGNGGYNGSNGFIVKTGGGGGLLGSGNDDGDGNGGGPNGGTGGFLPYSGGFGGGGGGSSGMQAGHGGFGGGGGGGEFDGGNGGFGGGGGGSTDLAYLATAGKGGFGGGDGRSPRGSGFRGGGGGAGLGGAIFNNEGVISITNSTLANNSAIGGLGGGNGQGLGGAVFSRNGSITLTNCTISGNKEWKSSGQVQILGEGEGGLATATINNNIISGGLAIKWTQETINNTIIRDGNANKEFLGGTNYEGSISSSGLGNLITSAEHFSGTIVSSADPKLGPLQNNGGPTSTMALLPGSPAIGAGDSGISSALPVNGLDQKGSIRVTSDIGALAYSAPTVSPEITSPAHTTFTVGTAGTFTYLATGNPSPTFSLTTGSLPSGVTLSSGGILAGIPITGGTFSFTVSASNGISPNANQSFTLTVNPAVTTTALTSSVNPAVFGETVVFTATVSASAGAGTPTGTITYFNGEIPLASGSLNNGEATLTISSLSVGVNSFKAVYNGDGSFVTSTSGVTSQVVNKAATATVLTSSESSPVYGQTVTFTATVSTLAPGSGTAKGSVAFYVGATLLATSSLDGGKATLTTSSLPVGNSIIKAVYNEDGNFLGSTSVDSNQWVNQAATAVNLTSLANSSVYGEMVNFTATVSASAPGSGAPTGKVEFFADGSSLGIGTINGGVATFAIGSLAVGNRIITAVYGGDNNFENKSFGTLTQVVNKAATTSVLSTSLSPSVFGQWISLTAKVTVSSPGLGAPTGEVEFFADGTSLGKGTLSSSGLAQFPTNSLAAGSTKITAVYAGDNNFANSSAGLISQVVNQAVTITELTTSVASSVFGQMVSLKATVSAKAPGSGPATGRVNFFAGATSLGSIGLNEGVAILYRSTLTVGSHKITATFEGNANFLPSTSREVSHVVKKARSEMALSGPVDSPVYGQSVTFMVKVTPTSPDSEIPTGMVSFFRQRSLRGRTPIATTELVRGVANLSLPTLSPGTQGIYASYHGDQGFLPTQSDVFYLAVGKASTSTDLRASVNANQYGQSVTFTVVVTANLPSLVIPVGTVTFFDGGRPIGTKRLEQGTTSLTLDSLPVGNHPIRAVFNGDLNFIGSTSNIVPYSLDQRSTVTALIAQPNPMVFGAISTIKATVTFVIPGPGTASGTVTFYKGSTKLGTARLVGGIANLSRRFFSVGTHEIIAVYDGDSHFQTSTSQILTFLVNPRR